MSATKKHLPVRPSQGEPSYVVCFVLPGFSARNCTLCPWEARRGPLKAGRSSLLAASGRRRTAVCPFWGRPVLDQDLPVRGRAYGRRQAAGNPTTYGAHLGVRPSRGRLRPALYGDRLLDPRGVPYGVDPRGPTGQQNGFLLTVRAVPFLCLCRSGLVFSGCPTSLCCNSYWGGTPPPYR